MFAGTSQPGQPPARLPAELPRWLRRSALALICLVLLLPALSILRPLPIYGDDHSSHMAAVHQLLSLLRTGHTDLFCPTFNLGFPMYLYYQPLPHLSAALVHLLSFGLLGEQLSFNLTVVALWCLYPLTTYLGARRLGLGDATSLLAAACAPAVSSILPFGFTLHSVMGLGLYTQLYAMVLFPLCLAWTWRALQADREARNGWLAAAGLNVLLWLSHAFYGVAAATAAVLMVIVRPTSWRTSLPRLASIGAVTLLSLLFWLVPLALTRDYAGGWPWDGVDRWDGYGALRVLRELLIGRLFDWRQLPLLSLAVAGGLAVALLRWRRAPQLRPLLALFVLFLLFLIGRRSLGVLVDIQPANRGLQMFRYIGPLHGIGVMLAAVGLAGLASALSRLIGGRYALIAVSLLVLPLLVGTGLRERIFFQTIRDYVVSDNDLAATGAAIAAARSAGVPAGRIYAHERAGTGSHLIAAAMSLYTDQELGQSYGLSMHDALGFYFLEHIDPLDADSLALYNFRFVLAEPGIPLARRQIETGNRPLLRRPALLAFALRGTYSYLQPVELSLALVGKPREIRPAALTWLRSGWPAANRFGLVVTEGASLPDGISTVLRAHGGQVQILERAGWRALQDKLPLAAASVPPGQLLQERTSPLSYGGRVRMKRPGAVVLKVGFHPFWEALVDGRRVELLHLTPCFLGVQVPSGVHEVSFRFRNPLYQKLLFLGAALGWLAVALVLAMRRAQHQRRS